MPNDNKDYTNIIIAIAIIVVLLLIVIWFRNTLFDDFLYGLWSADPDFCRESDLVNFMIMIGPSQGGILFDTRTMYVLMYNDEGLLCNRTVDISLGNNFIPWGKYQNRSLTIMDEDFELMPQYMTLSYSIMDGHMVLYGVDNDDDTIYASMYKDHDSSAKAKLLDE